MVRLDPGPETAAGEVRSTAAGAIVEGLAIGGEGHPWMGLTVDEVGDVVVRNVVLTSPTVQGVSCVGCGVRVVETTIDEVLAPLFLSRASIAGYGGPERACDVVVDAVDVRASAPAAVSVTDCNLDVSRSRITAPTVRSAGAGILAEWGRRATSLVVRESFFQGVSGCAIGSLLLHLPGDVQQTPIERNFIQDVEPGTDESSCMGAGGVVLLGGGLTTVLGNFVRRVSAPGITATGLQETAVIEGNVIQDAVDFGIRIEAERGATATAVSVAHNAVSRVAAVEVDHYFAGGVGIFTDGGLPTIRRNRVDECFETGIAAWNAASAAVGENRVEAGREFVWSSIYSAEKRAGIRVGADEAAVVGNAVDGQPVGISAEAVRRSWRPTGSVCGIGAGTI